MDIIRLTPEETRRRVKEEGALLVCAYNDDVRCKKLHLEDSISLSEFRMKRDALPKDQEIIFYCE